MSTLATHYSANDIETRLLDGIRAAGLDPDRRQCHAGQGGCAWAVRVRGQPRRKSHQRTPVS